MVVSSAGGRDVDHPRMLSDPGGMFGKPVIRGTWIPVETILRRLGAGDDVDQVLTDYPRLTVEDVRAAQLFVSHRLPHSL
jgi:uncharacterized protein (DUF433 family)